MMTELPMVAVAEGAFADLDGLQREFEGRARLRSGPAETPEQVAALTAGASALAVTLHKMTAEHIEAFAPTVRVLARAGVGLDTIDLAAAADRGVPVVYQPNYATAEVADQAAALALSAWRRVVTADSLTRAEGWVSAQRVGPIGALQESTVGVLGAGRIGQAFIKRIRPFARRVVVFDVVRTDVFDGVDGVEWANSIEEVLQVADLVSLHLPLTPQTRGVLDARTLALLPRGAVVVNASRGGLIDEVALAEALTSGHLGGAGLDVFESEPLPEESPLRAAPNLVITPHLAWYSEPAGRRLATWTIEDAVSMLASGEAVRGSIA